MKAKIPSLQAEHKKIQKRKKQQNELESLVATREKLKLSFFFCFMQSTVIEDLPKYSDCLKLDKHLLVLQPAYYKMIKVLKWDPEEGNWQPLIIIEQFQHAKVDPLFDSEKIL